MSPRLAKAKPMAKKKAPPKAKAPRSAPREQGGLGLAGYGLVLLVVCAVLFFSGLGGRALWETDEARYAETAREMVASGDYVTPTLNYVKYFEKPALTYWLVAASFQAFGVNEFAARLTPAVCGTLTVLLTFLLGRALWRDDRAGFWCGLVLATTFMFFMLSRVLLVDMVLCLGVVLALYGAWELREGRTWGLYAFWAGAAIAFMTKGYLGPGLPIMAVVLFALASGEWRFPLALANWRGILLFVLLTAPWVIAVSLNNPEFFRFFMIDEQFGRLLTTRHQRGEPWWYYFTVVPLGFFPWVTLLPWSVARAWPGRSWRAEALRPWLFMAVWFLSFFLFFSLSRSKMLHYALPMLPALALLTGGPVSGLLAHGLKGAAPDGVRYGLVAMALLILGAGLAGVLVPALSPDVPLDQVGVLLWAAPVALAGLAWLVFAFRRRSLAGLVTPLVVMGLTFGGWVGLGSRLDDYRALDGHLAAIESQMTDRDVLVTLGDYYHGVPFYGKRRTAIVGNWGELDFGQKLDPEGARWFFPDDKALIMRMIRDREQRFFIIAETPRYKRFAKLAEDEYGLPMFPWATIGDKTVFSNRPPH